MIRAATMIAVATAAVGKAKDYAREHPDQASQTIDRVEGFVRNRAQPKHSPHIDKGSRRTAPGARPPARPGAHGARYGSRPRGPRPRHLRAVGSAPPLRPARAQPGAGDLRRPAAAAPRRRPGSDDAGGAAALLNRGLVRRPGGDLVVPLAGVRASTVTGNRDRGHDGSWRRRRRGPKEAPCAHTTTPDGSPSSPWRALPPSPSPPRPRPPRPRPPRPWPFRTPTSSTGRTGSRRSSSTATRPSAATSGSTSSTGSRPAGPSSPRCTATRSGTPATE